MMGPFPLVRAGHGLKCRKRGQAKSAKVQEGDGLI